MLSQRRFCIGNGMLTKVKDRGGKNRVSPSLENSIHQMLKGSDATAGNQWDIDHRSDC